LTLEVRDADGNWITAIASVGLPTSKGLVVPVDLTGMFPGPDFHVRLTTNMRIYLDRIFVSTQDEAASCIVNELAVSTAELQYHGFSPLHRDDNGYELFYYDEVRPTGSWSPAAGMMTRYGDVTPLLLTAENMVAIFGSGDELTMRFDARQLSPLPEGWVRDYIFFVDGWVKDGDLNTKYSETIEPLPFHGMSGYPYPASEAYPHSPELQDYMDNFNTRPSVKTTGTLSRTRGTLVLQSPLN
jgi:hypothetical protein